MKIAVYCSAKDSIGRTYLQLGKDLGRWIGEQGHTLVYGGATGGLMTRVSHVAKEAGAKVIGVIPTPIIRSGRQDNICDQIIEVESMGVRKTTMREMADAFIVLPGSFGTLDEMMDVIASGTVGEHHKPIYILNYLGYYDALVQLYHQMEELKFLPKQQSYQPIFVNELNDIYQILNTPIV